METNIVLFNQVSSGRHLNLNDCLKKAFTQPVLSRKLVKKSTKRRFRKTFNSFVYQLNLNHLSHKNRELVLSSILDDRKNPKIKKIVNQKFQTK